MGNRHLEFRNIRTSLAAAAIALGGCASTDVVRHPVYKAISPTSYATRAFDIVTGSDTDERIDRKHPNRRMLADFLIYVGLGASMQKEEDVQFTGYR